MAPRKYEMQRRSANAGQTRERIVQATYELHQEKGIARTSYADIAKRADVGVGTVYHHFPQTDDILTACGALTHSIARPPGPSLFDGLASRESRVAALVAALFDTYTRLPGYERVRADRDAFPLIDAAMRRDEDNRRQLLALACGEGLDQDAARVCLALLDPAFYRALLAAGLAHDAAVAEATALLLQRLAAARA